VFSGRVLFGEIWRESGLIEDARRAGSERRAVAWRVQGRESMSADSKEDLGGSVQRVDGDQIAHAGSRHGDVVGVSAPARSATEHDAGAETKRGEGNDIGARSESGEGDESRGEDERDAGTNDDEGVEADEWDGGDENEGDKAGSWEAERRRLFRAAAAARTCFAAGSRRVARNMMLRYKAHLKPHRISVCELQVLTQVVLMKHPTAAAISRKLELDKSTVGRTIQRLTEKEWISVSVPRDARALVLELQAGAEERLEAALRSWEEAHCLVAGWLANDAAALRRLSARLRPPPAHRPRLVRPLAEDAFEP
jgi:DNA-binding MarR family transcriptional regulator